MIARVLPWRGSEAGARSWRVEVARKVERWRRARARQEQLEQFGQVVADGNGAALAFIALALALASASLMFDGRAEAPRLAAVALGLVAWAALRARGRQ